MVPGCNPPVESHQSIDSSWIGDTSHLIPAHKLIVLSFFDGIGSIFLAIENLCGRPSLAVAWETDTLCTAVTSQRFPYVIHRGDLLKDTPNDIADFVKRHDPHQLCTVLLAAAPPCPDFSILTGHGKGFSGNEGCKFQSYAEFAMQLEKLLEGWECHHLMENVVMQQQSEIQWVSNNTNTSPVIADAADFGLISRPRLWWTRIDWSSVVTNPVTGDKIRWGTINKLPRIYVDTPFETLTAEDLGDLTLPRRVENHEIRIPCMTTPAPDEHGRPAPKKVRGKIASDTRQRWLDGGRQWAPWHYDKEAMLTDSGGQLVLPPIELKERLHHFPVQHTNVAPVDMRARHRMLGNSWHVGIAQFILFFILSSCRATAITVENQTIPRQPRRSSLQLMMSLAQGEEHAMGPTPRRFDVMARAPAADQWDHWRLAKSLSHPMLQTPVLEPGAVQVLHKLEQIGDITRLRQEVVADIQQMIDDWSEYTQNWLESRPNHVRAVYQSGDGPCTQIPVFLELLSQCGYPAMTDISQDLSLGFDYVGEQHPGPGWLPRLDEVYAHPIKLETFANLNRRYIHQKLRQGFVDTHWKTMLQELEDEKRCGRVQGPFAAPLTWPCITVAPHGHQLLPAPAGPIYPSICFSVVQSDKIRRCEDLRRSFHNQTIRATQTPTHHTVDVYVDAIRRLGQQSQSPTLWSHDLDSAYRQFPVKDQSFSYTILFTDSGPTLWRHGALAFGATSSVWAFNRAADCLMFVSRKLLLTNLFHYVDDYAAVEDSTAATSSFETFTQMSSALGLRTKPKKACPPSTKQTLLGVNFDIQPTGLLVLPCPDRVLRIQQQVQQIIDADKLNPTEAQKLAGRLVFLQTTVFGQVGKTALQAVYARASSMSAETTNNDQLNTGLRSALQNISQLLRVIRPRWIPFASNAPQTLIYTDAFFELGGQKLKPTASNIPTVWNPSRASTMNNGWGMVCHTAGATYFSYGTVPKSLLRAYCHRKAFIYFLEAIAPLLTLVIMKPVIEEYVILFIDNQSALSALQKGYGKDVHVNNLVSVFWSIVNHMRLFIHFSWVPSDHNVSDKVSRHDLSEAQSQDWSEVPVVLTKVYHILEKAANDSQFAIFEAATTLLADDWFQLPHPRA